MRIVVNGQQAFGAAVLEALLERGEDVVAAYCAPDKPDRPPDPLTEAARRAGIPLRQPESFETEDAASELAELRPDLMVMAFVTLFVPEPVLNTPTHGSIQYHPSLLPRHRGPSAINWAIIEGDPKTGVAVFWPDEGLDTGPVLMLREVEIAPADTLGSLYFDKLFPLGVEAMTESVDLVRAGRAPKLAQDEEQATYESWCRKDDVEVDWSRPVADVHNLIRGADPRPGAWTTIGGEEVDLLDSRRVDDDPGAPAGEVIAVHDDELVIAADGGAIAIRVVRPGGEKVAAGEYARATGIEPGARLGVAERSVR
jgi:methionyl-tRNA formyltransferase